MSENTDKHTPGPWAVEQPYGEGPATYISAAHPGRTNPLICEMRPADGDWKANARLIAAAPDMLEALRMILGALDRFNHREDGAEDDLLHHLSNTIPDTIAKATGGVA